MSMSNGMRPVHPGEILGEELEELGLSANALAKALDVPTNRVTAILKGQRGVTADTASSPCPILRHDAPTVAEPSEGIRTAGGGDRVWPADRRACAATRDNASGWRVRWQLGAKFLPLWDNWG